MFKELIQLQSLQDSIYSDVFHWVQHSSSSSFHTFALSGHEKVENWHWTLWYPIPLCSCISVSNSSFVNLKRDALSQPHFGWSGRMKLPFPKLEIWSPSGLPNVYSSTAKAKTPRIGVFLMSLERSWSVDIENGLALAIWTFAAQVMGKRRAMSQTGNLTPDH